MRVLFVTSEKGLRGGERQAVLLRQALAELGLTIGLCAPEGAALSEHFETVFPVPMANELDPRGALGIRAAARRFEADLVHALTARAHGLARSAGKPLVVTRAVAYKAGKGIFGTRKYRHGRFIAVSRAAGIALEQAGVEPDRITVVPPAVRLETIGHDRAAAREKLRLAPEALALGCVAALEQEKGLFDLLRAFDLISRKRPQARLLLIGQGSLRASLDQRARGFGGAVRLLGGLENVPELLAGLDLYVQPSHAEGFGLAAAEAMAAGVPVVASATGGLLDLLGRAERGWLAPPEDPAGLAAAIESALADPEQAAKRARAARAFVEERLHPRTMAEATLAVYRKALGT